MTNKGIFTKGSGEYIFGLIGKNIGYSFSRGYFTQKFEELGLADHLYTNFDIENIEKFDTEIKNIGNLKGCNVTIPYKEKIIPFLDEIDEEAQKIGAVNTIKILPDGKFKGFNTDYFGFENSIKGLLQPIHKKALILGTGGASKAVAFALVNLGLDYRFVSRKEANSAQHLTYKDLDSSVLQDFTVLINTTPLGTSPQTDDCPDVPYEFISKNHLLFDLIYNPAETLFLSKGKAQGAKIKNGLEMLELQAEKAWEIWNS